MRVTAIIAIFAATAAALPASTIFKRDCEILKCAAALGPAGIACVAAAVQAGLDPLVDLPCVAAVINDAENVPTACEGCTQDL